MQEHRQMHRAQLGFSRCFLCYTSQDTLRIRTGSCEVVFLCDIQRSCGITCPSVWRDTVLPSCEQGQCQKTTLIQQLTVGQRQLLLIFPARFFPSAAPVAQTSWERDEGQTPSGASLCTKSSFPATPPHCGVSAVLRLRSTGCLFSLELQWSCRLGAAVSCALVCLFVCSHREDSFLVGLG